MTADRSTRTRSRAGDSGLGPSRRSGRFGRWPSVIRVAIRPEVFAAVAGALALAIRIPLLPFESNDWRNVLMEYSFIEENGYFLALRHDFSVYNPPYLYLMAAVSLVSAWIPKIVAHKAASIVFDFALAFFAYRIVRVKFAGARWIPLLAGAVVLFLPTVVMNGAMWGQFDAIHTTFLLACLHYLLVRRRAAAFACFGLALAIKPQGVFFAPFLLWLWMRQEVRLREVLMAPLAYVLTLAPAWLIGRPWGELLSIYFASFADTRRRLTMHAPNLYQWIPEDWLPAAPAFASAAGLFLIGVGFFVRRSRARLTPDRLVFLAAFCLMLTPFILPKMHDRYFFAAEVLSVLLAFYRPRYWYVPVVVGLSSSINYIRYLLEVLFVPLPWLALALLLVLFALGRGLGVEMRPFASARNGERTWGEKWSVFAKSRALPIWLLLVSLAGAVSFSAARHGFYRTPENDAFTYNALALASNLSAEHGYLGFYREVLGPDGEVGYEPHNRFPIGGLFLIKAVIMPFGDDLSAQLLAARLLMFAFFAAAALVAYLSLRRLTSHRWIALMATLLALSSYYWHLIDMVGTELAPDLFAVLLTFHGMVIFVQEGRFRQLLFKSGAALLVGWHVYALLLPFVVLGFLGERFRLSSFHRTKWGFRVPGRMEFTRPYSNALRSRYAALGAFALAVGVVVLGWNFASEYRALGGQGALTDIPSFQSFLYRTGQHEDFSAEQSGFVAWGSFLETQFHRIGRMSLPFGLPGYEEALGNYPLPPAGATGVVIGVLVTAFALAAAVFGPARLLHLTLALSGFVWALPMRHNAAFHDVEMFYYLGLMLVFFAAALRYLRRVAGERLIGHLVPAVLLVFGFSADRLAEVSYEPGPAWEFGTVLEDFEEIRRLTPGAVVFVSREEFGGGDYEVSHEVSWFLADSVIAFHGDLEERADFSIRRDRAPGPALVTPRNRSVFLYDRALEDGRLERMVAEGRPEVRSTFDVHRNGDWLIYVKEPCAEGDTEARFFLHLFPVDESRGPSGPPGRRFENRDFDYADHALRADGRCLAAVRLPEYEVRSVVTGQFRRRADGAYENLWRGEFALREADGGRTGADPPVGETRDAGRSG